jgi:8-oxo-dGTP diphosphatase
MSNEFEAGTRKLIPAVLIYAFDGDEVLLIHRSNRPGDPHSGKWNGLGGKMEGGESPLQAARREFQEESGIEVEENAFHLAGTLFFPGFRDDKGEDWVAWVYYVDGTKNWKIINPSEGRLHWKKASEISELPFWDGDREFLPYVLKRQNFSGTIWYRAGKFIEARISP